VGVRPSKTLANPSKHPLKPNKSMQNAKQKPAKTKHKHCRIVIFQGVVRERRKSAFATTRCGAELCENVGIFSLHVVL
jgi:hypothetical protein